MTEKEKPNTARNKVKHSSNKTESYYRTIFEQSPDGILIIDTEGKLIEFNEAACRHLGYSREEFSKLSISDIDADQTLKVIEETIRKVLRDGEAEFETRQRAKSGDIRSVLVITQAIELSGRIVFNTIWKDITDQRRADEARQKSEKLYRLLAENTNDVITRHLPDSTYLYVSPACRTLFGYEPEELIGRKAFDQIHPADIKRVVALTQEAISTGGTNMGQYRHLRKDGQYVWVETVGKVIKNEETGTVEDIICVVRDITERKRAEEALRSSREREHFLADIVEKSDQPMAVGYTDGRLGVFNRAFCELTGYNAEELRDLSWSTILTPPEWLDSEMKALAELERTGIPMRYQKEYIRKDGRRVLIELLVHVVRDEEGKAQYYYAFVTDITERKRREEELRKLNRTLQALSNSNQAMLRAENEDWYLNEICRIIVEDCGHALVWIGYAEQDEGKSVRPVAYAGFDEGYIERLKVTWADAERGRGPVGTAIRTGRWAVFQNILSDPRFAPWREEALRRGYAAAVGLPLLADGKAFGAITIYSRDPDPFSEDEVKLLTRLADDLAHGITAIRLRTERAWAEEAMRRSEEHYRTLFENMLNGFGYCKMLYEEGKPLDFVYLDVNPAFEKLTGLKDVAGKKVSEVIPGIQETDPELLEAYARVASTGTPERFEYYVEALRMWFSISVYSPQKEYFVAVFDVITDRKRAEEEAQKLTMAVEHAADWILITDRGGTIEYVNKAVENISGYAKEELIGKKPGIFRSGRHDEHFYKKLWKTILSGETYSGIFINRKKSGETFELHYAITPLKDGHGNIVHFIATAKDITLQKFLEQRLDYTAFYDDLTGLPNKSLFADRLHQAIKSAEHEGRQVAVIAVDIDRFTMLNDTLGYEAGDELLRRVGRRLSHVINKECTVARLDADKFGIVCVDVAHSEDLVIVLEKIRNLFKRPFKLKQEEAVLTLSMGISMFPADGKRPETLMKNTEVALSKSKAAGMNTYQFFTGEMNVRTSEFIRMQRHLSNALRRNEYVMYYQPYFDIGTQELAGMEALLRWKSPEFGLVLPGMFIPILEETGLMIDVGGWIVNTVCGQIKEWMDKGYKSNIVPVYTNLSLTQLRQKDLAGRIEHVIRETGIYPSFFGIEITESTFMEHIEHASEFITRLKKLGVSVSIDDFGTGYSSLSTLKRLPVDNLKIDLSFIRDLADNPDDASIVITIISMAHNLNLKTIAEGVETKEQKNILHILKCDMAQGYYFSRPLPAEEIENLFMKSM